MQTVFVTAIQDKRNQTLVRSLQILARFPPVSFRLVQKIDDAAIVLYMEHGYIGLTDLPLIIDRVHRFPTQKRFVYSESDWPYPLLPGAYPSLPRQYPWAHSWSYLPTVTADIQEAAEARPEGTYLFSFLGRISTDPVRLRVRSLDTPKTPCVDIEEAPRRIPFFDYARSYFDVIRASKFVLCPRGFGASSIRIFEVMSCGRVPVIIGDRWQPPPGVDWEKCSVVVREKDVGTIPALLERLEANADDMGQRSLRSYLELFAPNVFFDQLLLSMLSRYSTCSFGPQAVIGRALMALDWRALRTLGHQVRARVAMLAAKQTGNPNS